MPAARYQRIDDLLWHQWRSTQGASLPPGSVHQDRANTIRFVSRAVGPELTAELAFNDVKTVLEFVISADGPLGEAVGLDMSPSDE